jgi:cholesterol oxidase
MHARTFDEISVLVGSGVGGTSLIYLDVQIDAFPTSFDIVDHAGHKRWPDKLAWAEIMPEYYRRVFEMLRPSPIPEPPLKTHALKAGADAAGDADRFRLLDLAVYWGRQGSERGVLNQDPYGRGGPPQIGCAYCGECFLGCNTHSKNTLDLNYLWLAQRAGAEVYSQHNVVKIEQNPADHPVHPNGYRVHYEDLRWNVAGVVSTNLLILAAGTLGSTELLLRCKHGYRQGRSRVAPTLPDLSDRLGLYFSGNGDFGAVGFETNRLVNPMQGPTITATIDYRDRLNGHGFLIEDGGFPDIVRRHLRAMSGQFVSGWKVLHILKNLFNRGGREGLARVVFHELLDQLDLVATRDALPYLAMGIDAADGHMSIDDAGSLRIHWNNTDSMAFFRALEATLREITERPSPGLDGNIFLNPTWSMQRHLITVHPLGGCPMGDDETRGVVDPDGQVFGYPNLYVADGSIVPSALGPNPSKTIAALAERIAEQIIRKGV